jgi:hypothetical protein
MSNYTIAVNWSGKDALSDSDAAKVISGADFNTEFTTVQTAVNTKANINGSSVESFSATTATAGTNTTQVASTAFVTAAVAAVDLTTVYPVGSLYMNASSGTNPATLLGMTGTTWVAFGEGRMLLGENASHANGSTGGAETHTLTEAQMPAHHHDLILGGGSSGPRDAIAVDAASGEGHSYTGTNGEATENAGSGTAFSIMNPYITVYMWKRTA